MAGSTQIPLERKAQLIDLAECIAESNQTNSRTDLASILRSNDLTVYYDTFPESFDGLLQCRGDHFDIICNERTGNAPGTKRSRFTIAHELGHYFIDEHRIALKGNLMPSLGEGAKSDERIEREADLFASHLLLPTASFRKAKKKAPPRMAGIISLARQFDVSVKCTAVRYLTDDGASMVLTFRSWKGEMVWKWFSTSAWNAGIRKVQPGPVSGGATSNVLRKEDKTREDIEATAIPARYAFVLGDGVHYYEVFHEETIPLGEFGVLTLFTAQRGALTPLAEILNIRMR